MKNRFSHHQKPKTKSQLKKEKNLQQKTKLKNGIFFTPKTKKEKQMI